MTLPPEAPRRGRRHKGNITFIETEFATRIRFMVITLAKREAREAVIRSIRAEGKQRPSLMAASEITSLANAHLRAHAAQLLAVAEASGAVRALRAEQAALSAA